MRRYLFALIAVFLLLLSCSSPKAGNEANNIDPAKPTILIVILDGAQSAYKTDIIALLRKDYAHSYNVVVRNVKGYKEIANVKYDALIVMERLKAWLMFNHGVKNFIKNTDSKRTLYFITAGDPKWHWKRNDIQIVTSASIKSKTADTYQRLRENLDKIIP